VNADFAQANMLARAGNRDEAEIRRRIQASSFVARDASRADENNFSGTLGLHSLRLLREIEGARKIQRRRAGLGLIDGELNLLAVGLKQERGGSEYAGAHYHHAIGQRAARRA
jgi:hypothetical protein